jgi:acetyl-CoA C-acetyltransferase
MSNRVAVVGVSQTHHGSFLQDNVRDMVYGLVRNVLDPLGLCREDIDTVVSASSDYWMGISCSNSYYFDAEGAYLKNATKAPEDGALAFCYAVMRVLSGLHRTALVVGVTKGSEIPSYAALTNLYGDPFFQRPVGLNETSAAALQAQAYKDRYGLEEAHLAHVVIKNLGHALKNPYAHRKGLLSVEEVLASQVVAYPLRRLDCAEPSDGACVMLLACEEVARELTHRPAWVRGMGWSTESHWFGDRDLLGGSLRGAAAMAYDMAGIRDPRVEIDVAEVCEPTSFQELLWCEQLGLCEAGQAGKLAAAGAFSLGGRLPVNPSGGVLATHPYVARGLLRIAEAALQVKGEAGEHQAAGARTALAHSTHGPGGQSHTVVLLGVG